jgi:hypothetical protein
MKGEAVHDVFDQVKQQRAEQYHAGLQRDRAGQPEQCLNRHTGEQHGNTAMAHKYQEHVPAVPFCGSASSAASCRNTLSRGLTDSNRKCLCPAGHSPHATRAIKFRVFRVTSRSIMATIGANRFLRFCLKMYAWKLRP